VESAPQGHLRSAGALHSRLWPAFQCSVWHSLPIHPHVNTSLKTCVTKEQHYWKLAGQHTGSHLEQYTVVRQCPQ
jgi:hypothetical protein